MVVQGMDLDLISLETEIERVRQQQVKEQNVEVDQMTADLRNESQGTSGASSECSDEPYLEMEGNLDELFFSVTASDQEYLSTSIHSLLDVGDVQNCPGTLDWAESGSSADTEEYCDIEELSNRTALDNSTQHIPDNRRTSHTDCRHWSKMSTEQRIAALENLSHVISTELDLREQLEVIRLINPTANISPTDGEFVIELELITEDKMKKLNEYIKIHARERNTMNNQNNRFPVQKKMLKKQTKDRKTQQKAVRQRQRKEYRQMMKEKRSGLFVKEEVLALSTCEPIEEDDIDILS